MITGKMLDNDTCAEAFAGHLNGRGGAAAAAASACVALVNQQRAISQHFVGSLK
jgi:hypothetical protein